MSLFEATYEKPTLPKRIRLIECFAGIGAQAKALETLGADFEHWRTVEWSIHSIIAYNAIHIKDWCDKTEGVPYEEVLEKIKGVSSDYNKPMSEKELRGRGEAWARKIYSSMIAIHDLKPNIQDVKAADLGITEREPHLCDDLFIPLPRPLSRWAAKRHGERLGDQIGASVGD